MIQSIFFSIINKNDFFQMLRSWVDLLVLLIILLETVSLSQGIDLVQGRNFCKLTRTIFIRFNSCIIFIFLQGKIDLFRYPMIPIIEST